MTTDIVKRLRELIAEAYRLGLYTPSDMEAWTSRWYSEVSPKVLAELLDEIERLRAREETEAPVRELIRQDARNDALEEAAKVAYRLYATTNGIGIAAAIRALKGGE